MTVGPDASDLEPGYIPPDPDEKPPVDLWSAVGDVTPWGTGLLLVTWAVLFALLAFRREIDDRDALLAWGASATAMSPPETAWRLLASTFLHAGAAHVFFNGLSMLVVGPAVERIFTRWGFFLVYTIGGALASIASLAWRSSRMAGTSLSVGASGAIFALGAALLVAAYRLRHQLAPGRARAMAATLLFLFGQGFVAGFTRNGTDNVAHAAGILSGVMLGAVVPMSPRFTGRAPSRIVRAFGALVALALVWSLILAVRGGLGPR